MPFIVKVLLLVCLLLQPFAAGTLNVYCHPGTPVVSCWIELDR